MAGSGMSSARVRKAVRHRLMRVQHSWGALLPAQRRDFSSPAALRHFAMSADGQRQRVDYTIHVPSDVVLPRGPQVRLPHIKQVHISVHRRKLRVRLAASEPIHEGRMAWAIAQLLSPGLLPLTASGPDYVSSVRPELAAHASATAAGHRIKFGDYAGTSDTIALEASHALSVTELHSQRSGFDPFIFNPIGVNTRELGKQCEPAVIQFAGGGVIHLNGRSFSSDETIAAALREHC